MAPTSKPEQDRVRESTPTAINQQIDNEMLSNIAYYGRKSEKAIKKRLKQLDKEWAIERVLEVNASTLALTGLVLGATKDKRWLIMPGIVLSFLMQHGLQGWCPPLAIFRKLNYRTRKEIDEERNSLKALRGDFKSIHKNTTAETVLDIVRAYGSL
ncbi:hypothetical protein [Rufibacter soli]